MANPSPYIVSYSFSGFQASNPTTPLPAGALDNELANIATAVAQLGVFAENVIRPDGSLQNNIVTFDSLELGLQFLTDPTNGQLVAAAVAGAQASATAAAGSATTATTEAGIATAQAAAAATIRPPVVPEGCVAIFNGGLSAVGEWRIELTADQRSVAGTQ